MDRDRDLQEKFDAFQSHLYENYKFTKLGEGTYAAVYQKQGVKSVLKVFAADDGYVRYLALIANHKDKKAFPKILYYSRLMQGKFEGLHLVKMEALNPIDYEEFNKQEFYVLNTMLKNPDFVWPDVYANGKLKYLKDAADLIKPCMEKYRLNCDIHSENIMQRDNGDYVITDPFFVRRF